MQYVVGYMGYEEGAVVRLQGTNKDGELNDTVIEDTELAVNGRLTIDDFGRVLYVDADGDKDSKPGKPKPKPNQD